MTEPSRAVRRLVALLVVAVALCAPACSGSGSGGDDTSTPPGPEPRVDASPGSIAPGTTTPAASDADESFAARVCGASPSTVGSIAAPGLVETSGIVASRADPDLLWAHDDSGGEAELYAVALDGSDRGRVELDATAPFDWEDIALVPSPDGGADRVVVADIGDNFAGARGDSRPLVLHVIEEPGAPGAGAVVASGEVRSVGIAYPDGPHDAEALLADPLSGDLLVVTKEWDGRAAGVYRVPADALDGTSTGPVTMTREAEVATIAGTLVTGADVGADGLSIVVRTYADVRVWDRDPARSVAETLSAPPACTIDVREPQGEAVAVLVDGSGLVTISEGSGAEVNLVRARGRP